MIRILEKDSVKIISANVTDFSDALGYCEHKIPFYIKGIKAPPSKETIQGSIAHSKEEKYEEEHVEFVPITEEKMEDVTENIEFQREKIFTRLLIPFEFKQNNVLVGLFGRADKVYREDETLVVQDDKFTTNPKRYHSQREPYLDQRLQVLTYLNSLYSNNKKSKPDDWFSIPHKYKQWRIQIKEHGNLEPYKVFEGIQSKDDLMFLHSSIDRFARIVLEMEPRQHHDSAMKCKPCRYADKCEFVL
jgi:hypothetical protein